MTSPDAMQIGAYRVVREIGRGGMGIVHLGQDTRLGREVAIKAIPEQVADDPDRLARFEREARILASLNHPAIAAVYALEVADGKKYLVMEHVAGETLSARLDRGAIPVDEAIEIAAQIADGLEAAHAAGVVHRDLKPGNVMLTAEGKVKVLDFGLARMDEESSFSSSQDGPTATSPAPHSPSTPGAVLGTAPYMSPEQARGRKVDRRTDVWSFGVVLYEMLTGRSPFRGETTSDSIGAVLHREVEFAALPRETPVMVRHVLRRCLERDRDRRYRDMGDIRIELIGARMGEEVVGGVSGVV
ncbi:MAG: serine/threonine-protein kinase, partial [Planctomycetota bacterium]|nr:serine/threonine-protein kinase [Planctomycetota bacterium]